MPHSTEFQQETAKGGRIHACQCGSMPRILIQRSTRGLICEFVQSTSWYVTIWCEVSQPRVQPLAQKFIVNILYEQDTDYVGGSRASGKLVPSAVPKLHLPTEGPLDAAGEFATRKTRCAVRGCIPPQGASLHRIPTKDSTGHLDQRRELWLRACDITEGEERANARICGNHFKKVPNN